MLSTVYTSTIRSPGFSANTVHSTFRYPVDDSQSPQINWDIGNYDLLVLDEISMASSKIFDHVANTLTQLHVRPVVLLCGEQQQQKPIATIDGRITTTGGIMQNRLFYSNSIVINFVQQHRCVDQEFNELLHVLRYFKPSTHTIRKLEEGRVLCRYEPNDLDILNISKANPEALMVTVSRAATSRIN